MNPHRKEQITTNIRRAVQDVLTRGLADPRIRGLLSVTEVEISPDGREATVSISIYPEQYEARSMQGLVAGTMKIQRMVNDRLAMGRPPHLKFVLDRRLKKQAEILEAIRSVVKPEDADDESTDDAQSTNDAEANSATDPAGTS